ncbi:MAG TPA: NusA-like transcription termination signal-binding factor [Thermoplasmatales archaeon]|nr:NusA-like transcription termination signal-binding factor [Thermoplasmatales archaeon]
MVERTLSNEDMQRIRVATAITKADIIDCVEIDDKIIFVVSKGFLGIAIGKDARNIGRLRDVFKKGVKFVEFDQDEKKFVANLFKPFNVEEVTIEKVGNKTVAKVKVLQREKSKVIGKNGKNVQLAKVLARRHSSVDEIQIL